MTHLEQWPSRLGTALINHDPFHRNPVDFSKPTKTEGIEMVTVDLRPA